MMTMTDKARAAAAKRTADYRRKEMLAAHAALLTNKTYLNYAHDLDMADICCDPKTAKFYQRRGARQFTRLTKTVAWRTFVSKSALWTSADVSEQILSGRWAKR